MPHSDCAIRSISTAKGDHVTIGKRVQAKLTFSQGLLRIMVQILLSLLPIRHLPRMLILIDGQKSSRFGVTLPISVSKHSFSEHVN